MNENDYDNDGNNIVPCPICLNVYCLSKEGGKCPEEDAFAKAHQDPYEATGSSLRVHHPTQPKTQVERWREEIEENRMAYITCISCGDHECYKCLARLEKMQQLRELIAQDHEKNKTYLNRHPTGSFQDDHTSLNVLMKEGKLITSNMDFNCDECEVTLLDKIKKLLCWKS